MAVEGPIVGDELWDFGSLAGTGNEFHNHAGVEDCVWEAPTRPH